MTKAINIRETVWKVIETDLALKKDLARGILNIRALAHYILTEYKLEVSIDAVISAIRRYQTEPFKKVDAGRVYSILKQTKLGSITKIASLVLKKNDLVHEKIAEILPQMDSPAGEILRVMEGAKVFTIIFDQKNFDKMLGIFGKQNILGQNKKLGIIEIYYPDMVTIEKTPGVFSVLSNELSENDISIIDAWMGADETIIVVEEKNLVKGFDIIFELCN